MSGQVGNLCQDRLKRLVKGVGNPFERGYKVWSERLVASVWTG